MIYSMKMVLAVDADVLDGETKTILVQGGLS